MRLLLLLFILWTNTGLAQHQHTVMLEYPGNYFRGSDLPFGFHDLVPYDPDFPSLSYAIQLHKWGVKATYETYTNSYKHDELHPALPQSTDMHPAYSHCKSVSLDATRLLYKKQRLEVDALAGGTLQIAGMVVSHQMFYIYPESFFEITNQWNRIGVNLGFLIRYRIWKGITVQTTLTQTHLFKAVTQQNITNVKLGLGYTFGGGMNRSSARKSAP